MPSRFCRICSGWHDLDEDWPQACAGHFRQPSASGMQIIKDIEPYKAIASDIATGKPPVIEGRRQHREFMRRNNYVEIGNEKQAPRKPEIDTVSRAEIRHVMQQVLGRK